MNRREWEAEYGPSEDFPKRETRIWHGPNDPNAPDAQAVFDPYDDDLMHDLFGKHMGPALVTLFMQLRLHEMTQGSFGVTDKVTADYFLSLAKDIRKAAIKEWESQL